MLHNKRFQISNIEEKINLEILFINLYLPSRITEKTKIKFK